MSNTLKIDFSKTIGKMKPLHGVNNSPMAWETEVPGFAEAGIPYCRLHDAAGPFGGSHYVDINNVFPNFDADPSDPESYDFVFTDTYIKCIEAAGTEVFYRLGCTIENHHYIKAYNIMPPKDFSKWAEICAGIVRHYTQGWANGFKSNIHYWEIWNEPENGSMWLGSREQFYELYRIAARRLKAEFPDIKVGGYASTGFYAINRPDASEQRKSLLVWFNDFLAYVSAPETKAPLDFFSWHLYTDDPDEIAIHSNYVTETLRKYGFDNVENIFNEWNYVIKDRTPWVRWPRMKNHFGASFVAAAFALLQNSGVDKAMYYDAYPQRAYCGLYEFPSMLTTKTYDAFKAFNGLYKLGKQCQASCDEPRIKALAASNGEQAAVMLANHNPEAFSLQLELTGNMTLTFCRIIDEARHTEKIDFNGTSIELPPYSVAIISSEDIMGEAISKG